MFETQEMNPRSNKRLLARGQDRTDLIQYVVPLSGASEASNAIFREASARNFRSKLAYPEQALRLPFHSAEHAALPFDRLPQLHANELRADRRASRNPPPHMDDHHIPPVESEQVVSPKLVCSGAR